MNTYKEIHIPANCTHVKIDIGLSYCAPIANKWLIKEKDVYVLGFEPNPVCCSMIQNHTMPHTPFPDFNLEKKFIDEGRFQLLQYALSDVSNEIIQPFYVNKNDYY
jgi:hypothetical protein